MVFLTIFYKYTVTAPHSVFSQYLKQIKYQMLVVVHPQSDENVRLRWVSNNILQIYNPAIFYYHRTSLCLVGDNTKFTDFNTHCCPKIRLCGWQNASHFTLVGSRVLGW